MKKLLVAEHGFSENGTEFEGTPVLSKGESILLITTERDLIHCSHLEQTYQPEAFIFCSRHRSESGRPSLLVHSTGNYGDDADFGGNRRELSVSAPALVSAGLRRLFHERNTRDLDDFDVTLEVTHHGPTNLMTPMVFLELGSDEVHWRDEEGASAVVAAALDVCEVPLDCTAAIGFGGTHYASKFNKLVLEKDLKIGHMAPKYAIDGLTARLVEQMKSRTAGKVSRAIIDWKGTNAENKAHLFPLLEAAGLEIVRAKDL